MGFSNICYRCISGFAISARVFISFAIDMPISKIKNSLKDIAEIDAAIKGLSDKSPWQSIRDLALNF